MKAPLRHYLLPILLFNFTLALQAQTGSEIYLFDLKIKGEKIFLRHPQNITRHPGYDNQPFFHPDKPVLFYASADSSGRTDILLYDYQRKTTKNITHTHEREYSPTLTPDKKFVSCIIQRDSGAQDLGKYPVAGGVPVIIIDKLIVGYHAWADNTHVAVFTLPQPFKLHIIDVVTGRDTVVAENIGRALHKIPGENAISFVQKLTDQEWQINRLDLPSLKISPLVRSLPGKEPAIAWTSDGRIITNDGQKLFFFIPGQSATWTPVESDAMWPPNSVTRMAVSARGDKLAVVVIEP
jgi:hypothetical protein